MNDADGHLMSIFTAALDRGSAVERDAYLKMACGEDAALRARAEALLRAHERAGNFMEPESARRWIAPTEANSSPNAARAQNGALAWAELSMSAGALIGPYRLVRPIGEGGMGVVFMAEQSRPVRRLVALKLVKTGVGGRQVLARFEAERQALAMMDHPSIARVLDAGATEQGLPYFVMELVDGVPITQFCDDHTLTIRERLKLFVAVCKAVQHAHQKGVIHRDLKPSNVLVALYDGRPVPKVIDFGVAKATGQQLTEATLHTAVGTVVGTLEYMSPEQAELDKLDIDTRSDIYSLGVLLYELLTGTTPLPRDQVDQGSLLENLRRIREQEPQKPSVRLAAESQMLEVATKRGVEPRKLSGIVRGELDWIVMKALDKDRAQRYETANGLAMDLDRYLNNEPVQACPPSRRYQIKKLWARHKRPLAAVLLLLVALVGGIAGTTWGLIGANQARSEALRQAREKTGALREKDRALTAAKESQWIADRRLFESYVDQSRALRVSQRPGQRFESLATLRRAADLARSLGLPENSFHELRNAAIAALALPDLYPDDTWHPWPADALGIDLDDAFTLYARTDRQGNCSVRRMTDDAEIHHLSGLGVLAAPLLSRDGRFLFVNHFVNGSVESGTATGPTLTAAHLWELGPTGARQILSEDRATGRGFQTDPPRAMLAYGDGTLGLFDLPSGRRVRVLPPTTPTRETQIALHPTAPLIAVGSYFDSAVRIRDLNTGVVLAEQPQDRRPTSTIWHPNGRSLLVGYERGPLRFLDRDSLRPIRTLETAQSMTVLAFNPACDRLATSGWGGSASLFDLATGRELFVAPTPIAMLRFNGDGSRLAAKLEEGRFGTWQVGDGREFRLLTLASMPAHVEFTSWAAVSPDGRLVAVAMTGGVGLWDLEAGDQLGFVPVADAIHVRILFEQSGALLIPGLDGVSRWPVARDPAATGRITVGPPERLSLPIVSGLDQNADGSVTVGCSRAVAREEAYAGGWILHADRPDQPIRIDPGADIGWITVSPDGRWVVTVAHWAEVCKIWDARDGRLVKQLAEWGSGTPRFSPDGRWLSTALDGGRLLAVGTWEPGQRIGGAGTFSPDGRLVAVPRGEMIHLVETDTGRELAVLEGPDPEPTQFPVFSPDGNKLIGTSSKKGVRVWDLRRLRQSLAEMGLDWDAPAYPTADPQGEADMPLALEVRGTETTQTTLTPDEQARRAIEHYRHVLAHHPDDARHCNALAWTYLMAPESLRNVEAALPLAEKAVRLEPKSAVYLNTLGLAYYRAGRHEEAAKLLHQNLVTQLDWALPFDLFFLAMSHHALGHTARARDYHDWAARWSRLNLGLTPSHLEELRAIHAEADEVLGLAGHDAVGEVKPP